MIDPSDGDDEEGDRAQAPIEIWPSSEERNCWTGTMDGPCLARINAGEPGPALVDGCPQFDRDPGSTSAGRTPAAARVAPVPNLTDGHPDRRPGGVRGDRLLQADAPVAAWGTLALKGTVTLVGDAEALHAEARAALGEWIGAVGTWGIIARVPQALCLNLYRTSACGGACHLSVSGLRMDILPHDVIAVSFASNPEGPLVGHVASRMTEAVCPATLRPR